MDQLKQQISTMHSVYEMFVAEMDTHFVVFQKTVAHLEHAQTEDELAAIFSEEAKKLEHRFHLIKGSAGFLKLDALRTLSTQAEAWFKHGSVNHENKTALRDELRQLVAQLAVELDALKKRL
jgi:chemotaxis protein histidine kinase CheA